MVRRVINLQGATASPNPLSAAVVSGQFIFVSGQTDAGAQGIEAQTRSVLEKMGAVLKAAGSDHAHVLRCNVYLTESANFAAMNGVYREFFPSTPPARSTIITGLVNPDLLVEIDCIAELP